MSVEAKRALWPEKTREDVDRFFASEWSTESDLWDLLQDAYDAGMDDATCYECHEYPEDW